MKRILPLVIILVLLLSACQPKTPAPTPNLVQTAVVLTLTAQPTAVAPTQTPLLPTPTLSLPTPTLPLASATPTPLPPPPAGATAAPVWYPNYADQFIRYYYQNINARNYNLTWSLLTDTFKYNVNGPSQNGYQGYVDFWNTVARVDISSVVITGQSSGTATVTVAMTYNYFNGNVVSVNQPFNLLFDAGRNTWMFHYPTSVVVPTPIPASPQSFIYYYFDRINARDYGTTWSLLHDTFKTHMNPPSSGGYDGYVAYWNSVSRLDILGLTLNSQSGIYADITVSMVFNYTSGTSVASNQLFHLIYDTSRGTWLFYWP